MASKLEKRTSKDDKKQRNATQRNATQRNATTQRQNLKGHRVAAVGNTYWEAHWLVTEMI